MSSRIGRGSPEPVRDEFICDVWPGAAVTTAYYFRSDGYTVREAADLMTIECLRCGHLMHFSLYARLAGISEELLYHRAGCGALAITLTCVMTLGDQSGPMPVWQTAVDRFFDRILDGLFPAIGRAAKRAWAAWLRLLARMDETP